jgi:hypothetical protein
VDVPLALHGFQTGGSLVVLDAAGVDSENPGPLPPVDHLVHHSDGSEVDWAVHGKTWTTSSMPVECGWLRDYPDSKFGTSWYQGIESRVFNPVGFKRNPKGGVVRLVPHGSFGSIIVDANGTTVAVLSNGELSRKTVDVLRDYDHLVDDAAAHMGPRARARFLLACSLSAVVVVTTDRIDSSTRKILPFELCEVIAAPTDEARWDSEAREVRVAAALRCAYDLLWSEVNSAELPSVSIVMSSMRPEYVDHALRQVERQSWGSVQLMLGLHGYDSDALSPSTLATAKSLGVELASFDGKAIFGDVMRELGRRSDGSVIAKMDDDDWYGANHIRDLLYALDYSRADLVGSGVQFVYMHAADRTLRRNLDQAYRYGGHPGGPTFLLRRETLDAVGDWPRVRRAIDTGLNDSIVNSGGMVYQSGALNFVFNRRSSGHTWKASTEYFIRSSRLSWNGLRFPPGFGEHEDDELRDGLTARAGAATLGAPGVRRGLWAAPPRMGWESR